MATDDDPALDDAPTRLPGHLRRPIGSPSEEFLEGPRHGGQALADDFEVTGFAGNAGSPLDQWAVVSGNGDRDIFRIEIDGVAEEQDLHCRHQGNQGYGYTVSYQPQSFNAGDGHYPSEVALRRHGRAEFHV